MYSIDTSNTLRYTAVLYEEGNIKSMIEKEVKQSIPVSELSRTVRAASVSHRIVFNLNVILCLGEYQIEYFHRIIFLSCAFEPHNPCIVFLINGIVNNGFPLLGTDF